MKDIRQQDTQITSFPDFVNITRADASYEWNCKMTTKTCMNKICTLFFLKQINRQVDLQNNKK